MVVLKAYNNSNIEQCGICLVRLRHKDKVVRCRFFVVSGDGPVLLGMPDIKLLGLLNKTCNGLDQEQVGRKFDSQT